MNKYNFNICFNENLWNREIYIGIKIICKIGRFILLFIVYIGVLSFMVISVFISFDYFIVYEIGGFDVDIIFIFIISLCGG